MNQIEIENVNHPGKTRDVDSEKYEAVRRAFLRILPESSPGLTAAEIRELILPHLPDALFPKGATAGWWLKAVQLDLEAKGFIQREKTTPLRFHKV